MASLYIGIDNGVSGTIGFVSDGFSNFIETPAIKQQSYTVAKNIISRIDSIALESCIKNTIETLCLKPSDVLCVLERPMINPARFKASISAARSLEATIVVIESLDLPYIYVSSDKWQKVVLPKGTKGASELKKASMDIGMRLYPMFSSTIKKHKDADGIMIAYWAKKEKL